MKHSLSCRGSRGQGLIELLVLLPLLALILSVFSPLMESFFYLPWLDERLAVRQLSRSHEEIQEKLHFVHGSQRLPSYFDVSTLVETTGNMSLSSHQFPKFSNIFPGEMTTESITASISHGNLWNERILGSREKGKHLITRDLALLSLKEIPEFRVEAKVKKISLPGILSGKTAFLKKAGINLFHMNLDVLPHTAEGSEGKRR